MTTAHRSRRGRRCHDGHVRGIPRGRTLHLIDIENLAGATRDLAGLVAAGEAYRRSIEVRPDDHVVVGCDASILLAAHLVFPGARVVPGRGPDGADRALLACEHPDDIAARYDRVVIGSGDGAFCGLVWELRRRGVAVCVASRRKALSRDLRRAAGLVIDLRLAA